MSFRRRTRIAPADSRKAVELLSQAQRLVVLTGAGISTPSGIPDFRSELTGLWTMVDPLEVASLWGFLADPARFYEWMRPLALKIARAQPNPAHYALAELERRGRMQALVTQNIDALHQKSGSRRVIELHGHLRTVRCLRCGHQSESEPYLRAFLDEGTMPICPQCENVMKPDVVLFGEPLPEREIVRAQEEALHSDVMLVVGSSLEVMPAADLPALAVRSGSRLIIVNLSMTPYDYLADVVIHGDVAEVLPALVEAVVARGA
ncbi:MAG: NAD-dependent protein deacylase [Chloroflexi bacterium]|nr:MAG: NAD-dependent protein deacylase [Chloroflexota bacterium]